MSYAIGVNVTTSSDGVAVKISNDYVWTYHQSPTNELNRWDKSDGSLLGTISLNSTAGQNGMAYAFGSLWITDNTGTLRRYATDDTLQASIPSVGDGFCYSVANGYLWIGSEFPSQVIKVDPSTNTVAGTIATGFGNRAMTYGAGSIWTTNRPTGKTTVTRIDTASSTITATIDTSTSATSNMALVYESGYVLVGVEADDVIKSIDVSTNAIVNTLAATAPSRSSMAFGRSVINDGEDWLLLDATTLSEVDRISATLWNPSLLGNTAVDGDVDELWTLLNTAGSGIKLRQIVQLPATSGWGVNTINW
jgi:hypothetical protein